MAGRPCSSRRSPRLLLVITTANGAWAAGLGAPASPGAGALCAVLSRPTLRIRLAVEPDIPADLRPLAEVMVATICGAQGLTPRVAAAEPVGLGRPDDSAPGAAHDTALCAKRFTPEATLRGAVDRGELALSYTSRGRLRRRLAQGAACPAAVLDR